MGIFVKILISSAVIFSIANTALGCSCLQSHPQDILCSKQTFAALVKVRNVEYVYITERPKWQLDYSENSTHGHDKSANEKTEMERVEVVVKKDDLYDLMNKQFVVSYIRYRVKVYEAFKGMKSKDLKGKKIHIYTAPYDSLCGVTLREKDTYLLLGYKHDDQYHIGLCNYHLAWNGLDRKQKRVIRRNMRSAKESCDSGCSVQFCWSHCESDKNTCVWSSDMDRQSMKLGVDQANYACQRESGRQDAKCVWNDGLHDLKRGRRRRRNHTSGLRVSTKDQSTP